MLRYANDRKPVRMKDQPSVLPGPGSRFTTTTTIPHSSSPAAPEQVAFPVEEWGERTRGVR